jgi:hypothetical protein
MTSTVMVQNRIVMGQPCKLAKDGEDIEQLGPAGLQRGHSGAD